MRRDSQASVQASVRNCFAGTIAHIRREGANDEVRLRLPGGECIICLVTNELALRLKLRVGAAAYALVDPSSVILVTELPDAFKFSARNRLAGQIKQLLAGVDRTEVVIALQGGDAVVALVTNSMVQELELTEGKSVHAIFKATSVILGITA